MKSYQHLFFDLDHTLWDFDTNSQATLEHLYHHFRLADLQLFGLDDFCKKYKAINQRLWNVYNQGKLSGEELRSLRFELTFRKLGAKTHQMPAGISDAYTDLCSARSEVLPFAHELLAYLQPRYQLHIITNGFPESQAAKLRSSGMDHYFRNVITSICAGCPKPHRAIFLHALEKAGAQPNESLMIGDSFEADVLGAHQAGLDQVYYNPGRKRHRQKPTYEISCLSELMEIL